MIPLDNFHTLFEDFAQATAEAEAYLTIKPGSLRRDSSPVPWAEINLSLSSYAPRNPLYPSGCYSKGCAQPQASTSAGCCSPALYAPVTYLGEKCSQGASAHQSLLTAILVIIYHEHHYLLLRNLFIILLTFTLWHQMMYIQTDIKAINMHRYGKEFAKQIPKKIASKTGQDILQWHSRGKSLCFAGIIIKHSIGCQANTQAKENKLYYVSPSVNPSVSFFHSASQSCFWCALQ